MIEWAQSEHGPDGTWPFRDRADGWPVLPHTRLSRQPSPDAARRWWAVVGARFLVWTAAVFGLLVLPGVAAGAAAPQGSIALTQAQFQRLAPDADAGWQTVALPDTWAVRGLPQTGGARYRLNFDLQTVPAEGVWALRIDRLSTAHLLRVNGVLVAQQRGTGSIADHAGPLTEGGKPIPLLVEFPTGLLRTGDNQIDIEWRLITRAGMSDVTVGPAIGLRAAFDLDHLLDRTVPQLVNAAGAALAGFMLLIWWQRRTEHAFGLFGLLWLLVSLRNSSYYIDTVAIPVDVAVLLYFLAQCTSAVLLGAFAVSISTQRWPRFERVLRWAAWCLPLLGLLGAATDRLALLRAVVYPGVIALGLAALWVMGHTVRQAPRRALVALLLGVLVVLVAGAHDYLYLQGRVPITHFFWLPYAVPLGCVWFALVLVQRMVQALSASEDLAARLEARVAERTEALDSANQAQTRFLAAASHDLRQPVVAIGLLLGLVRERLASSPQAPDLRRLLDRTQDAARALEDLLRGLLDLSRLDTVDATPRPQPVPLQALFNAIATHEQAAAQAKGLRLRFRTTDQVVLSDPVLLEQVLRNLVGNALRYTTRGGVLVAARAGAQGVRLQVWDTGRGIASEDQHKVFEAFVQLDNPERDRRKGQGLGLAIVRRSVDLLGHPLALRSVPGRGSCFTVTLPTAAGGVDATDAELPPTRPLNGQRIWVLDDDPAVREALAERLEAWGARVRRHARLAELDQALAAGLPRPDWLLTDHRLPDGDGLQAIERLRARLGPVPVLLITGDTAPALVARFAALGLDVLHKPFRSEALLQRLQAGRPVGSGLAGRPATPASRR
jgi:signal transduction histidine kinase/ActR/RegA family two-component response regulator